MRSGIKKSKSKILESKPHNRFQVSACTAANAFAMLSRFCFRRCQHRKQFHFSFASFYFELLPLKHRIPLRQLEFSKQIPDILLYRQKTLFCWDELELHFLVLDEQRHNTELCRLDMEWLLRTPHQSCSARIVGRLCQTPTAEIAV